MSVEKIIIGYAISDDAQKSILIDSDIQHSWFYDHNASEAWKAIRTLLNGNAEVNLATVGATIPHQAVFLIECLEIKPIGQDLNFYINELKAAAWIKRAGLILNQTLKKFVEAKNYIDAEECLDLLEQTTKEIARQFDGSESPSAYVNKVLDGYIDELEKKIINSAKGESLWIDTGIKELNKAINGWMPGTLNILAARTSLGKTTLAINFANAAVNIGKKVLFFTNEMPKEQIVEKLLSLRTGIYNQKLFNANLNDKDLETLHAGIGVLYPKKMIINDRSGRRLSKFISEVKRIHRDDGLDMIVLDYIQQMSVDDGNRYSSRVLELGVIANAIKELSLELNIPIICLAQCNRQAENSDDPPNLSHIRDSGAIEQDADTVIFIHRERNVGEGRCTLVVAKNRFGPTGGIDISMDLKVNKFY